MKQNITDEQLGELTSAGRDRLDSWWNTTYKHKDAPHSFQSEDPYVGVEYGEQPNLSIGQMIEFLDEHNNLTIKFDESCGNASYWIEFDHEGSDGYSKELCDALWEACKEILEKDE